jgi:hypothetical protein
MLLVAPNLDHIANTKPGTRSKEGNNVFGCENGTRTLQGQERSHGLANGARVIVRGEEGKQRGRDTRDE